MKPLTIQAPAALAAVLVMAAAGQAQEAEETTGIPVTDQLVIDTCVRCHAVDDDGMMTRVSYMRKTPEGWQQSIRRMVTLNEVELEPEIARDIVRYLSDHHGIAPEELRPARFEVERRLIDWSYEASHEGDEDVDRVCSSCHSMGRVVTQRRTREEWDLLMATHRGYYPLSDTQGFRRFGPPAPDATDTRHPMDKAVAELSGKFPLDHRRVEFLVGDDAAAAAGRHLGAEGSRSGSRAHLRHGGDYGGLRRGELHDPGAVLVRAHRRTGRARGAGDRVHGLPVARPVVRGRRRGHLAPRSHDGRARLERDQRPLVRWRVRRVRARRDPPARRRAGGSRSAPRRASARATAVRSRCTA